jgi:hypothetical protein
MPSFLEVPWASVREGNRVVTHGEPRRVMIVRRSDGGIDVVLEDGTRQRHGADERTQIVVRDG